MPVKLFKLTLSYILLERFKENVFNYEPKTQKFLYYRMGCINLSLTLKFLLI